MLKRNIVIDAVALLVYMLVSFPALTGIPVHEWMGLGLYVVFFVHVCVQTGWILSTIRRVRDKKPAKEVGRLVLNVLLLIFLTLVTVSGLMVSGHVLPSLGLYANGYFFWAPLHAFSAKALFALILIHIVIHLRTVASFFKKAKPA